MEGSVAKHWLTTKALKVLILKVLSYQPGDLLTQAAIYKIYKDIIATVPKKFLPKNYCSLINLIYSFQ